MRDRGGFVGDWGFVGMGEVDEFAWLDAGKEAGTRADFKGVPTDVRDLFVTFGEARALIGKVAEAGLIGRFG